MLALLWPDTSKLDKHQLLSFYSLICIAFVARIHGLDHESLFMDELRQTYYYRYDPITIIGLAATQQQPPLDYWIGMVFGLFSYSDFSLRLPSALFGVLSVIVSVKISLKLTSNFYCSLAFGILFALFPFLVYFSQEARPYSISIFLFLLSLLVIIELLDEENETPPSFKLITTVFFLFLITRALVPLVTLFAIGNLLVLFIIKNYLFQEKYFDPKLFTLVKSLFLAVICFAPFMILILFAARSQEYIPNGLGFGLEWILSAINKFSFSTIWEAYLCQAFPIAYWILPLIILGSLILISEGIRNNNQAKLLVGILLPVCACLHLFIYLSKTDHIFRPRYAIYLLPLCLILASVSYSYLYEFFNRNKFFNIILAFSIVAMAAITTQELIHSKQHRSKPDWRQSSEILEKEFSGKHIVFTAFQNHGRWRPVFWGQKKRYGVKGPLLSGSFSEPMNTLEKLEGSKKDVVVMLFNYRTNYISPAFPYPIYGLPHHVESTTHVIENLSRNPNLKVTEIQSITFIELKNPETIDEQHKALKDLLAIINEMEASAIPENLSTDLLVSKYVFSSYLDLPNLEEVKEKASSSVLPFKKDLIIKNLETLEKSFSEYQNQSSINK